MKNHASAGRPVLPRSGLSRSESALFDRRSRIEQFVFRCADPYLGLSSGKEAGYANF
jgi:hypothetical protein